MSLKSANFVLIKCIVNQQIMDIFLKWMQNIYIHLLKFTFTKFDIKSSVFCSIEFVYHQILDGCKIFSYILNSIFATLSLTKVGIKRGTFFRSKFNQPLLDRVWNVIHTPYGRKETSNPLNVNKVKEFCEVTLLAFYEGFLQQTCL